MFPGHSPIPCDPPRPQLRAPYLNDPIPPPPFPQLSPFFPCFQLEFFNAIPGQNFVAYDPSFLLPSYFLFLSVTLRSLWQLGPGRVWVEQGGPVFVPYPLSSWPLLLWPLSVSHNNSIPCPQCSRMDAAVRDLRTSCFLVSSPRLLASFLPISP